MARLRSTLLLLLSTHVIAACADSQAAPSREPVPLASVPLDESKTTPSPPVPDAPLREREETAHTPRTTVVISAVGDCTLGTDYRVARAPGTFHKEMEAAGDDYRYPFSGVIDVLGSDDLTIANLETTLTTSTSPIEAPFVFSGKPEYARILKEGSVEIVSVANNHSHDFGAAGYEQTLDALREQGVGFFGNGHVDVRVVKGIEIVNIGYAGGDSVIRSRAAATVRKHKTPNNIVIVSFHWGVEGMNYPINDQKTLGRAAVDAGADLVLGHHPHVLQGIETYKGKHIVYSLGNFVFGGHGNPSDKDSMIYQAVFSFKEGALHSFEPLILPVRISSVTNRNDYRPVLLYNGEKQRILERIEKYSAALSPAASKALNL